MKSAVRPWSAAGVALAGASVIAVTPMVQPLPDVAVPTIELTGAAAAALDPLTGWLDVFETSFTNLSGIASGVLADPFPILTQVIGNQLGYGQELSEAFSAFGTGTIDWLTGDTAQALMPSLTAAFDQIVAGDFLGASETLNTSLILGFGLQSALPLLAGVTNVPVEIANNVASAVGKLPDVVFNLGLSAIFPLNEALVGLAEAGTAISEAISAGDPLAIGGALLSAPAIFTDAVLNGNALVAGFFPIPGLLSQEFGGGFLQALLVDMPQLVANAIANPGAFDLGAGFGSDAALAALGGFDVSGVLGELGGLFDPSGLAGDLGALFDPSILLALLGF